MSGYTYQKTVESYIITKCEDQLVSTLGAVPVNGASTGNVVGPASAVDENLAVFSTTTGKLIKDGLINKSAVTLNTAKVTNATHTGDATGATALTIAAGVVTNAKLATVSTATISPQAPASQVILGGSYAPDPTRKTAMFAAKR